jgi:dynein heavy chain
MSRQASLRASISGINEVQRLGGKDQVLVPHPKMELPPLVQVESLYLCPIYRTRARSGVLTTTGLSSNFIIAINIPSSRPSALWIKRSVALLCQVDD